MIVAAGPEYLQKGAILSKVGGGFVVRPPPDGFQLLRHDKKPVRIYVYRVEFVEGQHVMLQHAKYRPNDVAAWSMHKNSDAFIRSCNLLEAAPPGCSFIETSPEIIEEFVRKTFN